MTPNTERERATVDDLSSKGSTGVGTRKTYVTPRLERYGDLRALTQQLGTKGANDGGGGKSKTA